VVLTDSEAEPRHQRPVEFTWSLGRIEPAYHDGPFGVDAALFGNSGSWAAYFGWESGIAYLAGTPQFMELFLGAVGGIEVIIKELEHVIDDTEDWDQLFVISRDLERLGWRRPWGQVRPRRLRTAQRLNGSKTVQ